MTDEQMAALLASQEDVGGLEDQMAQQQALSSQLRGQALAPSAHKDWASQLSRGLQGGMAGYAMNKESGMQKGLTDARKKNVGGAMDILLKRNKSPANVMAPTLSQADLTGFGSD